MPHARTRFGVAVQVAVLLFISSAATAADKPLADQLTFRWDAVTSVSRRSIETDQLLRRIEVEGRLTIEDDENLVAVSNQVRLRRVITEKGEALEQVEKTEPQQYRPPRWPREPLVGNLSRREIPLMWSVEVDGRPPQKLAIVGGYIETIRARNIHMLEVPLDDRQWHEVSGVVRLRLLYQTEEYDASGVGFEFAAARPAEASARRNGDNEPAQLPPVVLRRVIDVMQDGSTRRVTSYGRPWHELRGKGELTTSGWATALRFEFAEAPRVERAHFSIHQLAVPRFDEP